jgi:hypothetical protein
MADVPHPRRETFDVFDTALTRAVGSPEAVFLLLGRRLSQEGLIRCSPETFARLRISAEERAHHNLGVSCRLEDIYREVADALSIDVSQMLVFEDIECEVESDVLRVVPVIESRVGQARAERRCVIYISDTFFASSFLKSLLEEHGLWQSGDRCYASGEWGTSKASGKLYDIVAREEGTRPQDFVHTGNDGEADVQAPRARGWAATPFSAANLNRYELLLEAGSYATEGMSSALAGASRLARLNVSAKAQREVVLRDVTAGVVGPVLTAYVLWLLRRARDIGLARLYFLARDGQVLLSIAQQLNDRLGLNLDLRYLYASRQAWNPAATFAGSATELAWIWDTTDTLTADMVLRRTKVAPEAIASELERTGLPQPTWQRQLSTAEREALGRVLSADEVKRRILAAAALERGLLLRYFEQERLLEDVPYGIIDLGWYGSMQKALAAVLGGAGRAAPPGFYFALHKGGIVDEAPLDREAYYFDERSGTGYIDAVPNLIALMEMFCTADHGTTVGFDEGDGAVRPVFREPVNSSAIAWGLPVLRETVGAFVDNLLVDSRYVDPFADVRGPVTAVLTEFSRHPTNREAVAWGAFPWEDGLGTDTVRNRFAQPYGPRDLLEAIRKGSIRPQHRAAWIEGSLALSPAPLRVALRGAGHFGRRGRALRARFRR